MGLTAAVLASAACGARVARAADELVLRLGHATTSSGWLASVGIESDNAVRMAVDEIQARRLQVGGGVLRVELLAVDDAADPVRARAVAQTLVAAGVHAVVGHLVSDTTMAAAPVYAAAGVPQLAPSATHAAFTRSGWATAFRLIADDDRVGARLGTHAVRALGARRVAVVAGRSVYGQGLATAFSQALQAAGGAVVATLQIEAAVPDFGDWMTELARLRPDAVFFAGMDRQAGVLLKQLRRAGLPLTLLGGDGICTPDLVSYWAAGAAADGQVQCALPQGMPGAHGGAATHFVDAYRARHRREAEFYGPYAYDAVMLLADAVQRAGGTEPAALRQALAATQGFAGVTGPIAFDARGERTDAPLHLHTYVGEQRQWLHALP